MPSPKFSLLYLAALFVAVAASLAFVHVDENTKTLLIAAATALLAKIQTIFDFYYGSSQGSKDKDALIKKDPTP